VSRTSIRVQPGYAGPAARTVQTILPAERRLPLPPPSISHRPRRTAVLTVEAKSGLVGLGVGTAFLSALLVLVALLRLL
jgi:hypothetical protein